MKNRFGWSLPPGCGKLPGEEDIPPCCEDCPEEKFEKCPGMDKCLDVYIAGAPSCCLRHKVEGNGGYCPECEAEAFRDMAQTPFFCDGILM